MKRLNGIFEDSDDDDVEAFVRTLTRKAPRPLASPSLFADLATLHNMAFSAGPFRERRTGDTIREAYQRLYRYLNGEP